MKYDGLLLELLGILKIGFLLFGCLRLPLEKS